MESAVFVLIGFALAGLVAFLSDIFGIWSYNKITKAVLDEPVLGFQYMHESFRNLYEFQMEEGESFPLIEDEGSGRFIVLSKEGLTIPAGKSRIIGTGVAFDIPIGWELRLTSRSGLAASHGVNILNSPGWFTDDYTGELKVILHNHDRNEYRIKPGARIADVSLMKMPPVPTFYEMEDADDADVHV